MARVKDGSEAPPTAPTLPTDPAARFTRSFHGREIEHVLMIAV